MLLDRGLLVQEGSIYRPTGSVETLEVPETLHALIAARLDGLTADERRLVQDAAVLGKTFTKLGIVAVTGTSEVEVEPLLASLVRKEVLSLLADPMSPERGQYAFLQDLVKLVAYETLSKKERKLRHVAAAAYIESTWGSDEEEFVEVVASHLDEAYRLAPDAEDAPQLRTRARGMLERAGERAGSLAAPSEAIHYFERAADLADETGVRAELIERAGSAAQEAGDTDGAIERFERAVALFEGEGLSHPAARVSAQLGVVMWRRGRLAEAVDRMERSYEVLASEDPDEDFAALAAELARLDFFAGRIDLAFDRVEAAIDIAEGLWLPEVLANALNTKGIILYSARGRRHEAYALLRYALELAVENDLPSATHRAMFNLADLAAQADRYQEARDYVEQGLALNRRLGNRANEWLFLGQVYSHFALGEWDEVLALVGDIPIGRWGAPAGGEACCWSRRQSTSIGDPRQRRRLRGLPERRRVGGCPGTRDLRHGQGPDEPRSRPRDGGAGRGARGARAPGRHGTGRGAVEGGLRRRDRVRAVYRRPRGGRRAARDDRGVPAGQTAAVPPGARDAGPSPAGRSSR
jgi:tetratricopeptide (TPR) repeat protein